MHHTSGLSDTMARFVIGSKESVGRIFTPDSIKTPMGTMYFNLDAIEIRSGTVIVKYIYGRNGHSVVFNETDIDTGMNNTMLAFVRQVIRRVLDHHNMTGE